jgi:hypothetical protein
MSENVNSSFKSEFLIEELHISIKAALFLRPESSATTTMSPAFSWEESAASNKHTVSVSLNVGIIRAMDF